MRRMGTPADIGNAVAMLCTEQAAAHACHCFSVSALALDGAKVSEAAFKARGVQATNERASHIADHMMLASAQTERNVFAVIRRG